MITIQDSLILAGAQASDIEAILEVLENDSIGYRRDEEASGIFTELDPAVLGQSPLWLNVRRRNIVQRAIRDAKGATQTVLELDVCWSIFALLKICTCVFAWVWTMMNFKLAGWHRILHSCSTADLCQLAFDVCMHKLHAIAA